MAPNLLGLSSSAQPHTIRGGGVCSPNKLPTTNAHCFSVFSGSVTQRASLLTSLVHLSIYPFIHYPFIPTPPNSTANTVTLFRDTPSIPRDVHETARRPPASVVFPASQYRRVTSAYGRFVPVPYAYRPISSSAFLAADCNKGATSDTFATQSVPVPNRGSQVSMLPLPSPPPLGIRHSLNRNRLGIILYPVNPRRETRVWARTTQHRPFRWRTLSVNSLWERETNHR